MSRNEGQGGMHSETNLINFGTHSNIASRTEVLLFSERAPCHRCHDALKRFAETHDVDVTVFYMTAWTDTDERYDIISHQANAQDAGEARAAVGRIRASFA
jgi:hypothetical protein